MSARPAGVDLWLLPSAQLDRLERPDRLGARLASVLSPDERERWQRLVRPTSRRQFLASRVLLRHALSAYVPRPPEAWRFAREEHGRPRAVDADGLDFNLAHTHHLVVVAVSRLRVGVDVERTPAHPDLLGVSHKVLTPRELSALDELPPIAARAALARHWVLKEAYSKALGTGLQQGFTTFGVDLGGPAPVLVDPAAEGPWTLHERRIGDHLVGLAVPAVPAAVHVAVVDAVRVIGAVPTVDAVA